MDRRRMLAGGLVAGVAGLTAGEAAAQEENPGVARALSALLDEVRTHFDLVDQPRLNLLGPVDDQMRQFLRANLKYPDFIEVGIDVWESAYAWHIQHRLPLDAVRSADGRYAIRYKFTTLLMRQDVTLTYVGLGFDGK